MESVFGYNSIGINLHQAPKPTLSTHLGEQTWLETEGEYRRLDEPPRMPVSREAERGVNSF